MPDDTHNAEGSPSESQPPAATSASMPKARPAPAPLPLDLVDEDCPRCHKPLAHEAVMCVNCGYDLKANVVREPEIGVASPVAAPAGVREFVTPGRGSAQVLATCAVFMSIAAMIVAGVNAGQWGAWVVLGTVGLTLYNIALHTCTGVVAVIVAAKLSEERFSRLELAAARMFLAVSLFYTISALQIPIPVVVLARLLSWGGAIGVYFLAVWLLFKKDRFGATLIALSHFAMWVLLEMGIHLAAWVAAGMTAAPAR